MHSILGFLGMAMLLLAKVNHVHADTTGEDAEGLRAGVVLEASEIDSSTVEVGALVEVVYGQGERHPVSGAWVKLDTVRGYIQVVTAKSLILAMEQDGWPESVALERIQKLSLIDAGRAVRQSTEIPSQRSTGRDTTRTIRKIISKLVMGDLSRSTPTDSSAVERERSTRDETGPKEITIYIRGEHKAVAAALLDAVGEGTSITGVADFDALSSTYGLIGIYRKGRRSSGFYGHRFRLTFPKAADVAAIAGAYWNLPYVNSVEPEPPLDARVQKADDQDSGWIVRVTDILIVSLIVGGLIYGIYDLINRPWGF